MTRFSVIMAAYNAEKYIEDAIGSVLNQTYEDWELVVVDDGSSDKTAEIVDNIARKDMRIQVIHQPNSGTAAAARNTALKVITGDYVQMLDADDLLEKNMLSEYNNKLSLESFDIIVPNCRCFKKDDISDIVWQKTAPEENYGLKITGEEGFELSLDWIIHGAFLVKRELILNTKYDAELLNGDEFTTRKLLYNAKIIGFINSLYFYRQNPGSTTKSKTNEYRKYESLLTDVNLYQYALNNGMPQRLVTKCTEKLILSFWSFCRLFVNAVKEETKAGEREYANHILEQVYGTITKDMWEQVSLKYRFFYYVSDGKYERFKQEMKLLNLIRGLRR